MGRGAGEGAISAYVIHLLICRVGLCLYIAVESAESSRQQTHRSRVPAHDNGRHRRDEGEMRGCNVARTEIGNLSTPVESSVEVHPQSLTMP